MQDSRYEFLHVAGEGGKDAGEVVSDGSPTQVMADPVVREAYVGDEVAAHA